MTIELAAATVAVLLVIGTPLAYWLAFTKTRLRPIFEALVAMPLVLPPTVLGFYLLLLFAPQNPVGSLAHADRNNACFFLQRAGGGVGHLFAALRGAALAAGVHADRPRTPGSGRNFGRWAEGCFFSVAAPLAVRGFITAIVLGFAHTIGEFGVVLMVGGTYRAKPG